MRFGLVGLFNNVKPNLPLGNPSAFIPVLRSRAVVLRPSRVLESFGDNVRKIQFPGLYASSTELESGGETLEFFFFFFLKFQR